MPSPHPIDTTPLFPEIDRVVRAELAADLGLGGDVTAGATVPPGTPARAIVTAKRAGTVAGLDAAVHALRVMDPAVRVTRDAAEGDRVAAGDTLLRAEGDARALLAAERTALNLLGRLSGIATATRALVDAVAPHGTRVTDTRKTAPGLRALDKAAVRAGGGHNHRFRLDDGVLIKDNHRAFAGDEGLAGLVRAARARAGHMMRVAVEVDTLAELEAVLPARPDVVLLDNMAPATLREAVARVDRRAVTEASGGITPASAVDVAAAGVDAISAGWLTHSAPALDVGMSLSPAA